MLYPSNHKVLPATGEQHHLMLPALDEMDASARVKGNGFTQDQRWLRSRLTAPRTEMEQPCRGSD